MIVCSCMVVSDHQIRDAVRRGLTWKEFVRECGLATACGTCARHAFSLFEKARQEHQSSTNPLEGENNESFRDPQQ